MTTDRRFCRFNKEEETRAFGMPEVPDGGLCLSAFLVIASTDNPAGVLMGHLDPDAPWDHIGALDPRRAEVHSKGWMLPSSHLVVKESPQDAATRIAREQLELDGLELQGPLVVSEVYRPKRFPNLPDHWDIEFIFRSALPEAAIRKPRAWRELKFVDLSTTRRVEIARSHEGILESAGLRFSPEPGQVS